MPSFANFTAIFCPAGNSCSDLLQYVMGLVSAGNHCLNYHDNYAKIPDEKWNTDTNHGYLSDE
jgi:hypothetical protein